MPLDASIYNALGVQPKSQADYADEYDRRDIRRLQLVGAQRQNELAALTSQQQQQNMQRNTLVQAAQRQAAEKAGGNVSAYADNLYLSGYPELIDPAEKVQKGITERGKVASENAKRDTETENAVVGMWRDMIGNSVNQQQAAQMVAAMHADPRIAATPIARVPLDQAMQTLQGTPFDSWKQQFALGATKFVEGNKPQYITQNLGGTSRVTALPGLGAGPAVVATEAPITQDANSIASNARMAADAAAGRAQSAAQFGVTSGLASEKFAYEKKKDAAEATNGSKATEGERNAAGYASRMTEATKLLDKHEEKGRATYTSNMAGGVYGIGGALRTNVMNDDQQQYRQAQEDWVRAKLRKESGASIATDEMDREIQAYFPQPGEGKKVIDQKRQSRAIATEAMTKAAGRAGYASEVKPAAEALTPAEQTELEQLRKQLGRK